MYNLQELVLYFSCENILKVFIIVDFVKSCESKENDIYYCTCLG